MRRVFTEEWLRNYQQRLSRKQIGDDDVADEGPESILQGKIQKWAKEHGYPCLSLHKSRKAKGFIVPGWPDITLILPENRTVFIELKSAEGYLKKKQKNLAMQFYWLGHEIHKVKSFKRFLEIVKE